MESELRKLVNKGLRRSGKRLATKLELCKAFGYVFGAFYQFSMDRILDKATKNVYNFVPTDFDRVKELITAAVVKQLNMRKQYKRESALLPSSLPIGTFHARKKLLSRYFVPFFSSKVWTSVPMMKSYNYVLHV